MNKKYIIAICILLLLSGCKNERTETDVLQVIEVKQENDEIRQELHKGIEKFNEELSDIIYKNEKIEAGSRQFGINHILVRRRRKIAIKKHLMNVRGL